MRSIRSNYAINFKQLEFIHLINVDTQLTVLACQYICIKCFNISPCNIFNQFQYLFRHIQERADVHKSINGRQLIQFKTVNVHFIYSSFILFYDIVKKLLFWVQSYLYNHIWVELLNRKTMTEQQLQYIDKNIK